MTFLCYEVSGVHREQDGNFIVGPGFHIAQIWAKERAAFVGPNQIDMLEIFTLPVGVKPSSKSCSNRLAYSESHLPETSGKMSTESLNTANIPSSDALPDTGLDAITEMYNAALRLLRGKNVDQPRKHGILSERAASMLVICISSSTLTSVSGMVSNISQFLYRMVIPYWVLRCQI